VVSRKTKSLCLWTKKSVFAGLVCKRDRIAILWGGYDLQAP